MTTTTPARAFGPADPTDEIRRAVERLAMLPDTALAVTMAQVLQAALAEMDGAGAYELLDSSSPRPARDLPQVCDRTEPRPGWAAALTLARAVLDNSRPGLAARTADQSQRPRIAAICGSARFRDAIDDAHQRLTKAGYMVFTPYLGRPGERITISLQEGLDDLHRSMIDTADIVFVVNPDGYPGAGVREEVEYAREQGKPVEFLVDPAAPGDQPREWFRDAMAAGRAADTAWMREHPDEVRARLDELEILFGGYASPPARIAGGIVLAAQLHQQAAGCELVFDGRPAPSFAELAVAMQLMPEAWRFVARTERGVIEAIRLAGQSWEDVGAVLGGDDEDLKVLARQAKSRYKQLGGDVAALDARIRRAGQEVGTR